VTFLRSDILPSRKVELSKIEVRSLDWTINCLPILHVL
jgi:hypothetical protein